MTAAQLRAATVLKGIGSETIACVEMPDGDILPIRATSTYRDPKTKTTYLILSTDPTDEPRQGPPQDPA